MAAEAQDRSHADWRSRVGGQCQPGSESTGAGQVGPGLRDCLAAPAIDEVLLAQWIKAVLFWGGVYTRHRNGGGNAGWLDDRVQAEDLAVNLRAALAALTDASVYFDRGPTDLRSNAGLTKVYSLVLDDFIIYDSRVAAALAWLVTVWGVKRVVFRII